MLLYDAFDDQQGDFLVNQIEIKHSPIFQSAGLAEKRSIYRYLFARKPKKLPPSLKTRLINLYDPMADRSTRFRDGLRWCLNVYVGCEHNCGYCYVNGYSQENVGACPHPKANFKETLKKDIMDLQQFRVPPAPLHMSNSTDPLQSGLEQKNQHTLFAFQQILENRSRFKSVVILTKNPILLCNEPYLSIINSIQTLTVQITCAFWRDEVRKFFEPCAPEIKSRLDSLEYLSERGIEVELRIDPLFPSSRISKEVRLHSELPYYSIPEAQSQDDIMNLVHFAKESGVKTIIAKPLKVPFSKSAQKCKDWFMVLLKDSTSSGKSIAQNGSWRLPLPYQNALMSNVADLCNSEKLEFRHCKHDVLNRK